MGLDPQCERATVLQRLKYVTVQRHDLGMKESVALTLITAIGDGEDFVTFKRTCTQEVVCCLKS